MNVKLVFLALFGAVCCKQENLHPYAIDEGNIYPIEGENVGHKDEPGNMLELIDPENPLNGKKEKRVMFSPGRNHFLLAYQNQKHRASFSPYFHHFMNKFKRMSRDGDKFSKEGS